MKKAQKNDERSSGIAVYSLKEASKDLVALGIPAEVVGHIVDVAMEIATELGTFMDEIVAERIANGACVHSPSLSLAVAYMAEKFLPSRLEGFDLEHKLLDPVASIGVLKKFVEVAETQIDHESDDKPVLPTIH